MTKQAKATSAFVLAFLLLLIKAVAPSLVTTQIRLLPVDASTEITSEVARASLLDSAAWENKQPVDTSELCSQLASFECFLTHPRVSFSRTLTAQAGATKKETTYSAQTRLTADNNTSLFDADDRVRLIRHSAFPVDEPVSQLKTTSPFPGLSHDLKDSFRDGLQYSFPYATEFRSYRYFDIFSASTTTIDFQDRETVNGVKVYRFHQKPTPIMLSKGSFKGAARQFYSQQELDELGLTGANTVVLNEYYTITRTLWVEPKTGTIVDSLEIPHIFLARDAVEAARTLPDSHRSVFLATLRWDEATQQSMWDRAHSGLKVLKWVSVSMLLVTIGSAAAVLLGIYFLRRRDHA